MNCFRILLLKIIMISCFCITPQRAQAGWGTVAFNQPAWVMPVTFSMGFTMARSMLLTLYYTTQEANQNSANFYDWKIDATTLCNIVWRSVFYGGINTWENQIRDTAKGSTNLVMKAWEEDQIWKSSILKTTASLLTYNSRYDETVVKRQADVENRLQAYAGEYAPHSSYSFLFVTNVGWFFVVPMMWSPQTSLWYNRNTPNPVLLAQGVHAITHSTLLATGTYAISDLLSLHALISIKHTIGGMFPASADMTIFRFPDCTQCYFFTNAMGKNGPIGSYLWIAREAIASVPGAVADFYSTQDFSHRDEL